LWKILSQLLLALATLESFNMLHRDIKGGNVFIEKDHSVKLGDFGLSREVSFDSHQASTLFQGTLFEFKNKSIIIKIK
jgi:serine/threonine protein kinase